jgi:predicted DNA-binding transcriptional regulator AlpA
MITHTRTFGSSKVPEAAPRSRRLITQKQLPEKGINYHPKHIRRMWQQGKFPAPIYTSKRRFAWPEEVIDRWIDSKIDEQAELIATMARKDEVEGEELQNLLAQVKRG